MPNGAESTRDFRTKDVVELMNFEIKQEEQPKSTWQLVSQYRYAILWSTFIGLAGINWGMDTLVRQATREIQI